eukprot:Protomagalhaensia_sp_Gyna_25__1236@NODE_1617_length_1686_cov_18_745598_g1323_i0_p1_GENE_NODE_1617_length_1686_cov_18_745598_g1323_i0NODE_1617_length_1686_cov_18_745598_g1323_i0_p1_ORF_typecomplete_len233_score0_68_NODE_1617_length_1686_cov_18_745598_g1323_i07411439
MRSLSTSSILLHFLSPVARQQSGIPPNAPSFQNGIQLISIEVPNEGAADITLEGTVAEMAMNGITSTPGLLTQESLGTHGELEPTDMVYVDGRIQTMSVSQIQTREGPTETGGTRESVQGDELLTTMATTTDGRERRTIPPPNRRHGIWDDQTTHPSHRIWHPDDPNRRVVHRHVARECAERIQGTPESLRYCREVCYAALWDARFCTNAIVTADDLLECITGTHFGCWRDY